MTASLLKTFAPRLIAWYAVHKRDLPWRNTDNPYLIWLSEIILQQTRVAQGLDYYLRFAERFPSPAALADASEDEVLKFWQGLGYYSRARNLHAAAKSMNGVFPSTYEGVLALKGVGEYTAAAVCSFAYRMPYAVVDGNVYRVLARLFAAETPVDSSAGKKYFTSLAQELLDKKRPDVYNQAIMDFGALQCVPASPACSVCPFTGDCKAYAAGTVEKLPVKAQKTKVSSRYFHYIYVVQGADTWLHKRTANDIWKNLYELPLLETSSPSSAHELAALPEAVRWFGAHANLLPLGKPIKHVLSHRVIHARFYRLSVSPSFSVPAEFERVSVPSVEQYAVSRLVGAFFEKYLPQKSN